MDISEFIKKHNRYIKENRGSNNFIVIHKEALEILKHERYMHLIVTMFSATFCCILLGIYLLTEKIAVAALFGILIILIGFYFFHYFKLENTTLEWEKKMYDSLISME